jgi:hypothetical protein
MCIRKQALIDLLCGTYGILNIIKILLSDVNGLCTKDDPGTPILMGIEDSGQRIDLLEQYVKERLLSGFSAIPLIAWWGRGFGVLLAGRGGCRHTS